MTTIASQNKIAVMACKTLTVDDTIALGRQLGRFMATMAQQGRPLCVALIGEFGNGEKLSFLHKVVAEGFRRLREEVTKPNFCFNE